MIQTLVLRASASENANHKHASASHFLSQITLTALSARSDELNLIIVANNSLALRVYEPNYLCLPHTFDVCVCVFYPLYLVVFVSFV